MRHPSDGFDADPVAAKQAIFEYCKKRGALAVGVADLAVLERIAPPGHRPTDLMPRVKSVISLGVGGQTQGAWQLPAKAMAHDWPGNVRELENAIERAAILAHGPLLDTFEVFAPAPATSDAPRDDPNPAQARVAGTLEEVERAHIQRVLEQTQWVIEGERGAALTLGINASTLRGRMRKLGIRRAR